MSRSTGVAASVPVGSGTRNWRSDGDRENAAGGRSATRPTAACASNCAPSSPSAWGTNQTARDGAMPSSWDSTWAPSVNWVRKVLPRSARAAAVGSIPT